MPLLLVRWAHSSCNRSLPIHMRRRAMSGAPRWVPYPVRFGAWLGTGVPCPLVQAGRPRSTSPAPDLRSVSPPSGHGALGDAVCGRPGACRGFRHGHLHQHLNRGWRRRSCRHCRPGAVGVVPRDGRGVSGPAGAGVCGGGNRGGTGGIIASVRGQAGGLHRACATSGWQERRLRPRGLAAGSQDAGGAAAVGGACVVLRGLSPASRLVRHTTPP